MKKILLFISVLSIASSFMALDIFTSSTGKKTKTEESKEVGDQSPENVANTPSLSRPTDTICAVTGTFLKVNESTPFSKYNGDYYYFISKNEKAQFDSNPFKYAKDIETCLVCGKQEKKTRGRSSFLEMNYNGKIYRFCTLLHSEAFQKEPERYVKGSGSYLSKQIGKKKTKTASKAEEKAGSKDLKKGSSEDVEILSEDTPVVKTPAPALAPALAPVTAPAVVPATAPVSSQEKKETKQTEKTLIIDIEKKVPEIKQAVPAPAAVKKVLPEKVKAPKKEVTMEFEDTIIEE